MLYSSCSEPIATDRVAKAYAEKEGLVEKYLNEKNLSFKNGIRIFLRAFKKEEQLELWVKNPADTTYQYLLTYPFCKTSGTLGPKRKEGDRQIPEGFYHINRFNPKSSFYLSLGINYPNQSDKLLGDQQQPGSDIFIHGKCQTVGCIPITDDKIKELYIFAAEAKKSGQSNIAVHIFPTKMTDKNMNIIVRQFPEHQGFWENLQEGYTSFEQKKVLPNVEEDAVSAKYYFF